MKLSVLFIVMFLPIMVLAQKTKSNISNLVIGTYTQPGKSEGLYVYEFNSATGDLVFKAKAAGVTNPSFLAISKDNHFVYAVNETGRENPGGVSAFRFDPMTGNLTLLNQVKSMGDDPCYISIDKKGKHVFVGNYSGGNLSAFRVLSNGSLSDAVQVIQHEGSGADKSRQEKAHVHSTIISPDGKYLLSADLGTDKVYVYKIHKGNSADILTAQEPPFTTLPAGSGPRHLDFHPNGKFAYLIQELTGDVTAYKYHKGKLDKIQTVSMLAPDFKGQTGAADIHVSPDGKFLYASNRGDANDIAIFSIQADGTINMAGRQSTLGKGPRNFAIDPDGNFLLVANQNSDEIVVFKRDKQTGSLSDTGKRLKIGQPVCLKFAPLN